MSRLIRSLVLVCGAWTSGAIAQEQKPIAILLAAGDIGRCGQEAKQLHDTEVGDVIAAQIAEADALGIPVKVLALGDLDYGAEKTRTLECFDEAWGRFKDYILPIAGNHEYRGGEKDAAPFFAYFANTIVEQQGKMRGYYSLDFPPDAEAAWHLVAVNLDLPTKRLRKQQLEWLVDDLAGTSRNCVLAFTHEPRFSSDQHGHSDSKKLDAPATPNPLTDEMWDALHGAGVSAVLAGHEHTFEQFAPMRPDGTAAPDGLRSFVVGIGGTPLSSRAYVNPPPNREALSTDRHGALKLSLFADRYDWDFLPTAGEEDLVLTPSSSPCTPNVPS